MVTLYVPVADATVAVAVAVAVAAVSGLCSYGRARETKRSNRYKCLRAYTVLATVTRSK